MTDTKNRAITVHAEWAWAIVNGHKPIELRSWKTNYRGRLLIHTGLSKASSQIARKIMDENHIAYPNEFERGKIIGSVHLIDCKPVSSLKKNPVPRFDKWLITETGYYWELSNPIAFREPIEATGKQGFWDFETN